METQSVYHRLKKMQGILDQVPKDIQEMYGMKLHHTETDSVWLLINVPGTNHAGLHYNADIEVIVSDFTICFKTPNVYFTIWRNIIDFHTSIFG